MNTYLPWVLLLLVSLIASYFFWLNMVRDSGGVVDDAEFQPSEIKAWGIEVHLSDGNTWSGYVYGENRISAVGRVAALVTAGKGLYLYTSQGFNLWLPPALVVNAVVTVGREIETPIQNDH